LKVEGKPGPPPQLNSRVSAEIERNNQSVPQASSSYVSPPSPLSHLPKRSPAELSGVSLPLHRYTIRTNGTVFKDSEYGRFDGRKLTERWDNREPNAFWRNYWAFMNLQNAFDSALMSYKVRASPSGATTGRS
jgi:hypothetical protein